MANDWKTCVEEFHKLDNNFKLPISIKSDDEYLPKLKNAFNEYITNLKASGFDSHLICAIENMCNRIVKIIEEYYNGNLATAKTSVLDIIKDLVSGVLANNSIISSITECSSVPDAYPPQLDNSTGQTRKYKTKYFFKASTYDKNKTAEDMYHIPFNKREAVKSQRFSIPGVPCMYLGSTSYCCWVELGCPAENTFRVSAFQIPDSIKVLNLAYSLLAVKGENEQAEQAILKLYPIVCATSFKDKTDNKTFRSEYIISNFIMQCTKELAVDGILYYSKSVEDAYATGICVTLAIPAFQSDPIKQRAAIFDNFKGTDPMLFEFYKNITSTVGLAPYAYQLSSYIQRPINRIAYDETKYCEFDNYLISMLPALPKSPVPPKSLI